MGRAVQLAVMLSRTKLRLLTLHEMFSLVGAFADLHTAQERQDTKKGRFKPSKVLAKAKRLFYCKLFPPSAG